MELAGALAEIANDTLRHDFRSIHPEESQILLLDGAPRVLPVFPESLSEAAERSLARLGVRSRTGVKVTAIDETGVMITSPKGEERIEARTVLWAAGVAISSFIGALAQATGAACDKMGRIRVEPDLTVPGHPEIFVVGTLRTSSGTARRCRESHQWPCSKAVTPLARFWSACAAAVLRRSTI